MNTGIARIIKLFSRRMFLLALVLATAGFFSQICPQSGWSQHSLDEPKGDHLKRRASRPGAADGSLFIPADEKPFQFDDKKLTVNTKRMTLRIEAGAITYVKNRISGEVLVDTNAYVNRPFGAKDFVGFTSKDRASNPVPRWPMQSSEVHFSTLDATTVRLSYDRLLPKGTHRDTRLIIDVTIDPNSGEAIVQLTGIEADPASKAYAIDLPIMNVKTPTVILGSGAKYSRADSEATDQTAFRELGLYSPTMAIAQGSNSVLAVWSETTKFAPEYIRLDHKPGYDHIVLHTEQDPKQTDAQKISSPPWRVSICPTWVTAAKRWRELFEKRTGAKRLWENRTSWVRKIHAVFNGTSQSYGTEQSKYDELASKASPERVLYFIWNGDRIVLFGDHTLVHKITRPTSAEIEIIKKHGWRLLLYHPYNLIYSEKGERNRLLYLAKKGWLPSGYQFIPNYEGAPQNWQNYWSEIRANYYDDSKFFVIHPGSTRFFNYFVNNFRSYCSLYRADGAYLDILGADHNFLFGSRKQLVDGQDYVLGEINMTNRATRELPQLAIMSEYQSSWMLPFAFYSWEGSVTHLKQNAHARTRINHPLRVALAGSYSWMRESNAEYMDDVAAALLGTLPEISMVGDHDVSKERALWSQARARLFCEKELFNDLPDKWDEDAVAYYRSKNGNWFKFKYLGSTYGYVEVLPSGNELVRLAK